MAQPELGQLGQVDQGTRDLPVEHVVVQGQGYQVTETAHRGWDRALHAIIGQIKTLCCHSDQ